MNVYVTLPSYRVALRDSKIVTEPASFSLIVIVIVVKVFIRISSIFAHPYRYSDIQR